MTNAVLGNYSLSLALLASCGAILAAIAAVRLDSARALRLARWLIHSVTALLTVGSAALLVAFLKNDFSLDYVMRYSERALPLGYKVAAFWAGQEGSLLLWAWMTAGAASLAAILMRKEPASTQSPALGLLAGVCGAFIVVMLYASNPFQLGQMIPPDGYGMNPMLQHPAMILHPPLLFLGYAGIAVPFALLLGALIAGRRDNQWLGPVRNWMKFSWISLTVGIALGAWWAYVELGWGGYWAWDPVENASILPWFTATALLHSLMAQHQRGMLKVWNAILVPLTFILCIFGTYLTRSGVLASVSVHSYPESPVGWYFLAIVAVGLVLSAAIVIWRRDLLKSDRRLDKLVSREGAFVAVNTLLVLMMLITLIGTIYPLLTMLFVDTPTALERTFYNIAVLPIGLALLILMGTAPLLRYTNVKGALRRRMIIPVIGLHVAVIVAAILSKRDVWTVFCTATCTFAVLCIIQDVILTITQPLRTKLRRYGWQVAHLGMVMIMVGVAGSSLYGTEKELSLTRGESAELGRYDLKYDSFEVVDKPNHRIWEARLTVTDPKGRQSLLRPQRRIYTRTNQRTSEVGVRSTLRDDVFIILAGLTEGGETVHLKALVNPLLIWIWIGSTATVVGCLICLLPVRRKSPAGAPPAERDSEVEQQHESLAPDDLEVQEVTR